MRLDALYVLTDVDLPPLNVHKLKPHLYFFRRKRRIVHSVVNVSDFNQKNRNGILKKGTCFRIRKC